MAIYRDTADVVAFAPARFIRATNGDTFSHVGLTLLIRAHLALAEPEQRMRKSDLIKVLRIRTPFAHELFNEVIANRFIVDEGGFVRRSPSRPYRSPTHGNP